MRAAVNPPDMTGRGFSSWSHFKNDPGVSLEGNHKTNCLNGCRLEQSVTPDLFLIAYDLDLLLKQSENIALPHLSPKHVSGAQEFKVIKHQLTVHLGCFFFFS